MNNTFNRIRIYSTTDSILEEVNYDDRRDHVGVASPPLPKYTRPETPKFTAGVWNFIRIFKP